ncbi:MAG: hypothetical protein IK990_15100 [Ruminiclostridium sp.]|nr:hypothetical protein [Ruminiclostridium sp.]MBP3856930.1 hypothetical protein [Ruminiclostridium sp.]
MSLKPYTVLLAAALLCSSGCMQVGSTVDPDDGYYTEIRMSELEYRTFLAKKTSGILNMLVSHAALTRNISDPEYDTGTEIESLGVTIASIDEAVEDIKGIGAASDSEKIRENLLSLLDMTREHLVGYKERLMSDETITKEEAEKYAGIIKSDFTALKAF